MTELNPPAFLQNRSDHTAQGDRLVLAGIFTSHGVPTSMDLHVYQEPVADMSVNADPGHAYIFGTEDVSQGVYHGYNDGVVNKVISPSHGSLVRLDRLEARVLDEVYSGGSNLWEIFVNEGDAGSGTFEPLSPNAIELAKVTVNPGVTSIVDVDIDTSGKPILSLRSSVPIPIVYTTPGQTTWNQPPGLRAIKVRLVAGGGSGGGAQSTGGGQHAEGGGGAGGGYSEKFILAANLGATEVVTVGAGGDPADAGHSGHSGEDSSFGSHLSATGGNGGNLGVATGGNNTAAGGAAGTGMNGSVNVVGGDGGGGKVTTGIAQRTNRGGGTALGGDANSEGFNSGTTGKQYGGGSSGARNSSNDNARDGARGGHGIVIVDQYF